MSIKINKDKNRYNDLKDLGSMIKGMYNSGWSLNNGPENNTYKNGHTYRPFDKPEVKLFYEAIGIQELL